MKIGLSGAWGGKLSESDENQFLKNERKGTSFFTTKGFGTFGSTRALWVKVQEL
ncbi:hypothetical protein KGV52_01355 [Candidatus Gracilibacteria bacterium]|nr:hypothetical protein [Candidatus Gracilibacteria bacterium]